MTFGRRPSPEERAAARAAERQANLRALGTGPKPLARGVYGGSVHAAAVVPVPKMTRRQKVRQDIRDSARGEACTVRIPGCPSDPEKTIWSHFPGAAGGKGMATKSLDLCGAFACTYCDGVADGQVPRPAGWTREEVLLAWMHGHIRSLLRLAEKGLL